MRPRKRLQNDDDEVHEKIMNAILDDRDQDPSDHRYIYEVVTFTENLHDVRRIQYYTNAIDCHKYIDDRTVSVIYKRVLVTSPIFAMAFHNSIINRI